MYMGYKNIKTFQKYYVIEYCVCNKLQTQLQTLVAWKLFERKFKRARNNLNSRLRILKMEYDEALELRMKHDWRKNHN